MVAVLKTRCNTLREDNEAFVTPSEALELWKRDVGALAKANTGKSEVTHELLQAYESGVAIASKQRQFELADALCAQMKDLGLLPTARTHQILVRNVALELRNGSMHTPMEELRDVLKDVSDDKWERQIMEVIHREERPVHLKTEREFAVFQKRLVAGVEARLGEYEKLIDGKEQRSTLPYNEALRVYADNGIPFSQMLQLMVARNLVADVGTYEALLLGARWNEIPATLSQLLNSKLVNELSSSSTIANSDHVHTLWTNAMKAIIHSSVERFGSLSAGATKHDVDQLRKLFLFVDKQLSSAFPKFCFAEVRQHDDVYSMRIKAASACGLIRPVKRILDEYVTRSASVGAISKKPFLSALEVYPWAQIDILLLTREDALARAEDRDVRTSPRVQGVKRVYDRVMRKLNKAQKTVDNIGKKLSANVVMEENEKLALEHELSEAARTVEEESRLAETLERRLTNARVLKANQLLIQEHLKRADNSVEHALSQFLDAGFDAENDLDFNIKLMEQYMASAKRFEKKLTQRQKHVSSQIMARVFKLATSVSEHVESGGLNAQDPATREKLVAFFERAICAAVHFWRPEETAALVRQQQRLLGDNQLNRREYDLLIFQRVTNLDVRGAHSLLEEMHFAGVKPSPEAIDRIAIGLLHQLGLGVVEEDSAEVEATEDASEEQEESVADDVAADAQLDSDVSELLEVSEREAIEKELGLSEALRFDGDDFNAQSAAARAALLGSDAPMTIEDLIGFLQDWYNLYRVKPMGKTVVPVLAQLLKSHNFPEFKRLLQILESMDGGLTPATQLWLEKRLHELGDKTLDDFRLAK